MCMFVWGCSCRSASVLKRSKTICSRKRPVGWAGSGGPSGSLPLTSVRMGGLELPCFLIAVTCMRDGVLGPCHPHTHPFTACVQLPFTSSESQSTTPNHSTLPPAQRCLECHAAVAELKHARIGLHLRPRAQSRLVLARGCLHQSCRKQRQLLLWPRQLQRRPLPVVPRTSSLPS